MSKLTAGVITFILVFSIFNGFCTIGNNESESEVPDAQIPFEGNPPEIPGESTSRAGQSRTYTSSWSDHFTDSSRISSMEDVVLYDGSVKLDLIDDNYKTAGDVVSTSITPSGKICWDKFHANTSEININKRELTLDNTGNSGNLLNHSVSFTIDTQSLIAAGKMKLDGGDIRFYNETGEEISYWLEGEMNTTQTEIWLNIPFIPASSTAKIYMQYGNFELESKSSGKKTFKFFDGFESEAGYDTNYWSTSTTEDFKEAFNRSCEKVYDESYSLRAAFKPSHSTSMSAQQPPGGFKDEILTVHFYDTRGYSASEVMNFYIGHGTDAMKLYSHKSQYVYQYREGGSNSQFIHVASRRIQWHEIRAEFSPTDTSLFFDNKKVATRSATGYYNHNIAFHNFDANLTQYYDAYFLRNYTSPQPTITVGSESVIGDPDISFKILNATDETEIMSITDGQDISNVNEKSIKLKAEFQSNGGGSVLLNSWGVEWNTYPTFEDITASSDSVYRTQSVRLEANVTDTEQLEFEIQITNRYNLANILHPGFEVHRFILAVLFYTIQI
jgi:hypothetical protein